MAGSTNEKMQKNRSKRVTWGLLDPVFGILGPPPISRGRIMLETSNLAHIWMVVSVIENNAKYGQKGSCGVT